MALNILTPQLFCGDEPQKCLELNCKFHTTHASPTSTASLTLLPSKRDPENPWEIILYWDQLQESCSGLGQKLKTDFCGDICCWWKITHGVFFLRQNHLAEIIIVNSNAGKISHVPLIMISGFVGLVYKLYPLAFSRKKESLLFLIHSFQSEFQAYITRKRWNPILRQTHKRLRKMLAFPVPPERLPWRSLRR